ncbi:AraC family transcriptional regulator [Paenibacillus nasutitermitis]|uniref:HTH araC/xylS-type domain-containing protein n=1 Tax=Paenibacillus nasutitermitis TaxID=1652958 RepID=A0A917DTK7_9BACL|nr:AraC family transcriptional regulator [Paenibacillus nasutitermitis]GGD65832.1 hypothetical protein GCM10010911_24520 [Paenibacillus nasutitermitis]
MSDQLSSLPVVPFIRESDYAIRRPWNAPERRLLDYLLIYIQEGICQFAVDRQTYRFESGQLCLVQPGSLVALEGLTDTITPYAHLDIFYNEKREQSFATRPGQLDLSPYRDLMQPRFDQVFGIHVPVRLEVVNPKKFSETLIRMIELWQQHSTLMQLKAQLLASELVISILEAYDRENSFSTRNALDPFGWIVSYFSVHLNEPLSIQDMAGRANLSPSRFSALFKERYGVSPHQYLMDMRITHSRELLQGSTLSQEEIASYCGFADIHHFSKTFKKRTGLTPGDWRNMRRKNEK